jgi:hypothetical protein
MRLPDRGLFVRYIEQVAVLGAMATPPVSA